MSFLSPWALALSALALVPVILHLYRRDTKQRLAFPAIRYLRSATDRSARVLKVRDRFLLLVRVGLALSIAAAAAVPLLGRGAAADHDPSDIVLLIDNSASMSRTVNDTTLLDRQRSRALELLSSAVGFDRFWILPSVGPILASGVESRRAAEALRRVEPTDAAAELPDRVRESLGLLPPDRGRPREIVVMSDFQATSLRGSTLALPEDVRLSLSWSEADAENRAIVAVEVVPPAPDRDGSVIVRVADPGAPGSQDTAEVRLAVDGEVVSIGRTAEEGSAVLRFPYPGEGETAASVETAPSGLRADDAREFVVRTTAAPSVAHYGPAGSYVDAALSALDEAGLVRLVRSGNGAQAWWSEGVPPEERPGDGPATWILSPPPDDALLARFNAALRRLGIPWKADVAGSPGITEPSSDGGIPGLDRIELSGRHRLRRTGAGADSILLATGEGLPWIVSGRSGGRAWVLIGSPLVPDHTDLPTEAAMVPFVEAALFRWAGLGGSLPAPTPAGTRVVLPANADSLRLPSGRTVRVDGGMPYTPLRAGLHTAFVASGERPIAVTVPLAESDLRPMAQEAAARALGSTAAVSARSAREWEMAMFGSRRGRSAAVWLVGLALLLALAEGFLAAPGRRVGAPRRRGPGDSA